MVHLFYGALGGLIRVLLGWQGAMQKEGGFVAFDFPKAGITIALGAASGIVAEPLAALLGFPTPLPPGLVIVIGASAAYFLEDALARLRQVMLKITQ